MLGKTLALGACVRPEQETSSRRLASSSTNPPRSRLTAHPSDTPTVSSVFSALQRTGSLITNQTIDRAGALTTLGTCQPHPDQEKEPPMPIQRTPAIRLLPVLLAATEDPRPLIRK